MEPTIPPQSIPIQPVTPIPPVPVKPKSSLLSVLIVILLLLSLGAAGFFAYQNYQLKQQITQIQPTPQPKADQPLVGTPVDPTADWKTYTDTKNRFTFRYPANLTLSSSPDYDYIYYLETQNYKPFTAGAYQIQIEIFSNNQGIPKTLPSVDTNTPEGTFTDKRDFIHVNGATGIVTTYKEEWVHYKRYDMFSDSWKVDFFGTGAEHSMLDQILSTFKFTQLQQTGFISGKLCYPADHVPSGIITAKNIDTGAMTTINYKWDGHSSDNPTYKIELKPGNYHVKYESVPDQGDATGPGTTYYTDLAKCTFVQGGCDSRSRPLLTATVIAGETLFGIHPCDINTSPNPPDF